MRFRWTATGLLILLASVNNVLAEELFLSFSDPVGDEDVIHDLPVVAIDVARVDFSFTNTTGDYTTTVFADRAHPFVGHFSIIVHMFNPDAGTTLAAGFASSVSERISLVSPQEVISWSGKYSGLAGWKPGHRVAIGTSGLGNPSDARFSLYGSALTRSTDNTFEQSDSIDYLGQAGGWNGQSTVVATIVQNPSPPHRELSPGLSPRAHPPIATQPVPPFRMQQPRPGPEIGAPVIAPRVATKRWSWSDELEGALAFGFPAVAVVGGLVFVVRTFRSARSSPQHECTMAFGLLSTSLSLLALGCSAIPFVPPDLCAVLALGVSAIGIVLAIIGSRQSEQLQRVGACVVGLAANAGVQFLALTLLMPNAWHLIDRLEHRSPLLLLLVQSGVLVSVLSLVGIRVWLWLSQRARAEHRFHFGLSSLLLWCGAVPIWLWLSLTQPIPDMLWGGGLRLKSLHEFSDFIDMISDLTNFGALSTFLGLMTPFALYAVTVAVHPIFSQRRDSWPLSALMAGLIVAAVPLTLALSEFVGSMRHQ